MKKLLKFFIFITLILATLVYVAGSYLTYPHQRSVGTLPPDVQEAKAIQFPSKSNAMLSGWFLSSPQQKGAILLLHGVKSNRLQMLNRANFLQKAGYSVLLIDFQAHGESQGEQITFGHLESLDAESAYDYLRQESNSSNIAVIGVSLGGASALLGNIKDRAKVMILESVYPSIKEAIEDRFKLYFGEFGRYLSPLLTMQLKPRLDIELEDLRPIDQLKKLKGAVMIIAGSKDQHTTLAESKRMFAKAHEPKELWVIEGAKHVDFDTLLGEAYQKRILLFLEKWMK